MLEESGTLARRRDPWFVLRPGRAKVVVALSFVAVFVLHLLVYRNLPLRMIDIAFARSGDKGDSFNIGVIAFTINALSGG